MKTETGKYVLATALAMATIPGMLLFGSANAAQFNYDYIEIDASRVDVDFGGLSIEQVEVTSFGVIGSYSYSDTIVVGGGYGIGKGDTTGILVGQNGNFTDSIDVESTVAAVFVLYHAALNDKADYQVGADYARFELETTGSSGTLINNASVDGDSKGLFAGIRYQYNNRIELDVEASYDLDADEDEFGYDFGARYDLDASLELGFNVDPSGDETTVGLNLRKYLF